MLRMLLNKDRSLTYSQSHSEHKISQNTVKGRTQSSSIIKPRISHIDSSMLQNVVQLRKTIAT